MIGNKTTSFRSWSTPWSILHQIPPNTYSSKWKWFDRPAFNHISCVLQQNNSIAAIILWKLFPLSWNSPRPLFSAFHHQSGMLSLLHLPDFEPNRSFDIVHSTSCVLDSSFLRWSWCWTSAQNSSVSSFGGVLYRPLMDSLFSVPCMKAILRYRGMWKSPAMLLIRNPPIHQIQCWNQSISSHRPLLTQDRTHISLRLLNLLKVGTTAVMKTFVMIWIKKLC